MRLVNLTPHAISLHGVDGVKTLQSEGIARLAVTREPRPDVILLDGTFPVVRPTLGAVTGLPDAREGVIYVVSALVAEAVKRPDVMSPGELIRDAAGVIIGARGLCAYV